MDARLDFITTVSPLLRTGRQNQLAAVVAERWSSEQLIDFMVKGDARLANLSARCLSLVGRLEDCPAIVPLLGGEDAPGVERAETVLWQIWMRAGSREAVERLAEAVELLSVEAPQQAFEILDELTQGEPDFAEAHHQAGVAAHALDRVSDAERHFLACVRRNPYHFAARAALGHLCVERDAYAEALRHYRAALEIHPNLPEICEILPDLHAAVARRIVA